MASQNKLPLVPEEITAEWLSSKLGHAIQSIELTHQIVATTSKLFYKLTYENDDEARLDRPRNIVVKGGFNPAISQAYPLLISLYRREAEWFAKVAPQLKHVELPKAWWSDWNHEQGILILEDLSASGCTFGSPTEAWSVDLVMQNVEQLAAVHAGTWGFSQESHKWLSSHYDQAVLDMIKTLNYNEFLKLDHRPQVPEYLHDEANVVATLKKHYASRNPRFRCLIHGDTHTANTYFAHGVDKAGNKTVKPRFLDWQMIDVGSCFHDVAYFLIGSLTIEDRRANEKRIVEHYLDALARFGGPKFDISDPEVWLEYQKSTLTGIAWVITPREMQSEENINAMLPRYIAAFDDHKVFDLIASLPEPVAA